MSVRFRPEAHLRKQAIYGRVFLMDVEDEKKIDLMLVLAQETNVYVKKIRKVQKTGQIFKIVYWTFIIILMFGGFYFLQPYLNVLNPYSTGITGLKNAVNLQSSMVQKK